MADLQRQLGVLQHQVPAQDVAAGAKPVRMALPARLGHLDSSSHIARVLVTENFRRIDPRRAATTCA